MGDIRSWDCYFQSFDKIACVSESCKREFIEQYKNIKNKFTCIYNMFSIEDIKRQAAEKMLEDFDSNSFNIVTVSRIEFATKATDRIVRVCSLLKKKKKCFHWYLVGNGPDEDRLEKMINEYAVADVLSLCGNQSNPHAYVKHADLSVLLSNTEAYSMAVIESIIIGTPIIVTNYNGAEEAVVDGVTGLIVPKDDSVISNCIERCIEDKAFFKILKDKCKHYKYSNDTAYQQFNTLFDDAM